MSQKRSKKVLKYVHFYSKRSEDETSSVTFVSEAEDCYVLTVSDGRLVHLEAIMSNIRERPVCGMSWLILHATVTVLK